MIRFGFCEREERKESSRAQADTKISLPALGVLGIGLARAISTYILFSKLADNHTDTLTCTGRSVDPRKEPRRLSWLGLDG